MTHRDVVPAGKDLQRDPMHQHFIFEGLEYPATKQDLVEFATDAEADADTINLFLALPDRPYAGRDDVWRAVDEATARR